MNKKKLCSITALLLAILLFMPSHNFNSYAASAWNPSVNLTGIDSSKPMVALSFDDGPVANGSSATQILDIIQQYGVHCTFFYVGQQINSNTSAEISRAKSLGCEIANHTYTHSYLTSMNQSQIQSEISRTSTLLTQITGQQEFLVRPPYLAVNDTVKNAINTPLITCQVDSKDWNGASASAITSNVLNNVQDGSIVLMHETYSTTAEALKTIIPTLLNRGYQIVTISQMMKAKGTTMYSGNVYTNAPAGSSLPTTTSAPSYTNPPATSTSSKMECEAMTLSGQYAGKITSPFSGIALYANIDSCKYTQNFSTGTHSFSLRGCSNNSNMAKVDLVIGGQTKGSFYFGGSSPAVYTINNVSHGTGNQTIELVVTSDNGQWDAYIDYLQIQ